MAGRDDPAGLLAVAEEVARTAGAVLLAHQRRLRAGEDAGVQTKSSATDPVSVADADSERVLVEALTAARPDDGLLGEEGAHRRGSTGLRWVVDPLDGTVNFLYGHPGWSVSVAVEREEPDGTWRGIAGAVLDPVADQLFAAHVDGPATCDGIEIAVNDPVELPHALIGTGFSYERDRRLVQAEVVTRVLAAARDVRRVGSAALDLCAVAAGRVDGYYEDTTQRWDWAAGVVIARQAGAVVTPLTTQAGTSGVVASGPALHADLVALVTAGS
ncbi:inositol monophosphatase [Euzebya sp.]|uniref:inositol monophosphatase family protein n=1 Tax=Euzebya sp. TaxID=1971409 RepID=UPI003511FD94